jgi:hypothetical protein
MAGYSGTPLARKLGIKPGSSVFAQGAPTDYEQLLAPMPEGVRVQSAADKETDVAHLFSASKAELAAALKRTLRHLRPDAALWVSWPKKASKVPTDITEDVIRELAFPLGLVDVKVCAVDDVWSGLKLVLRKELRPAGPRAGQG